MSRALITEGYLTDIANAIRAKNGSSDTYTPPQMAAAIEALDTSGIHPTGTKNITQNGTHDVTQYAIANVSVTPNLQSKTATENGTVTPDQGYDGLSSVVVNVSGGGGIQLLEGQHTKGYVNGSTFYYDGNDYECNCYPLIAGHEYVAFMGATLAARWRAMTSSVNTAEATANVSGTRETDISFPRRDNAVLGISATENNYLTIYIGSKNAGSIYVIDLTSNNL